MSGRLPEFEIVLTIFWGNEKEILGIADHLPRGTLVLQQGVRKRFWKEWTGPGKTGGNARKSRQEVEGDRAPLTFDELADIAESMKRLGRTIKIRTRERGEVVYESDRGRWPASQR